VAVPMQAGKTYHIQVAAPPYNELGLGVLGSFPPLPAVYFGPISTPLAGTPIQFRADVYNTLFASVTSALWDFGDGTTASGGQIGIDGEFGPPLIGLSHTYTSGGTYQLRVTVTLDDGRRNTASTTVHVDYAWGGFLSPLAKPPAVNRGAGARVYPLKWQLKDANGNYIGSLGAVSRIGYTGTACNAFTTDPTGALPAGTAGGSTLRYDARGNQYVYNWQTPGVGCYTLFLTLNSGQVEFADFNLR
jgi:hypothetical protein